jgi:hypothetical protein
MGDPVVLADPAEDMPHPGRRWPVAVLGQVGKRHTVAHQEGATGNYHRPLAWRPLQAGFTVQLISSLALARTREALHNGWDKYDPKGCAGRLAHAPDRGLAALP